VAENGRPNASRLTEADVNRMKFPNDHDQVVAREKVRKPFVLAEGGSRFDVKPNPSANSDAPWYEFPQFSEVGNFSREIEAAAAKEEIDPNLIRTIMYLETTRGWYDAFAFGSNSTVRPMNISVEDWGRALGFSRSDLEKPSVNIEAGAKVLRGIVRNLPAGAPVSVIATLYNVLGAPQVNRYGARAQKVYRTQPWKK